MEWHWHVTLEAGRSNAGLWLVKASQHWPLIGCWVMMTRWHVHLVCRVRQRALDTDWGHSWGLIRGSDWSQHPNTGLWLTDVITGQCIAMCCQNMSQHWSYLRLCVSVFIWTKWLDLNQTGEVDVIMYGIPLSPAHSTIAPWDTICMWALSQFPYWGGWGRGVNCAVARGDVVWLHLNVVISLYAAHYKRHVWSTLLLKLL